MGWCRQAQLAEVLIHFSHHFSNLGIEGLVCLNSPTIEAVPVRVVFREHMRALRKEPEEEERDSARSHTHQSLVPNIIPSQPFGLSTDTKSLSRWHATVCPNPQWAAWKLTAVLQHHWDHLDAR